MGGAMDLVAGAQRVIVAMQHVEKNGAHKLVQKCTLPLTGVGCIDRIVTDYAVLDVIKGKGFRLVEWAPDLTPEFVVSATGAPVEIAPDARPMSV
jgi:3-oxoacid CoA-transferase subunit B